MRPRLNTQEHVDQRVRIDHLLMPSQKASIGNRAVVDDGRCRGRSLALAAVADAELVALGVVHHDPVRAVLLDVVTGEYLY